MLSRLPSTLRGGSRVALRGARVRRHSNRVRRLFEPRCATPTALRHANPEVAHVESPLDEHLPAAGLREREGRNPRIARLGPILQEPGLSAPALDQLLAGAA